jgi:hypothetical protein
MVSYTVKKTYSITLFELSEEVEFRIHRKILLQSSTEFCEITEFHALPNKVAICIKGIWTLGLLDKRCVFKAEAFNLFF